MGNAAPKVPAAGTGAAAGSSPSPASTGPANEGGCPIRGRGGSSNQAAATTEPAAQATAAAGGKTDGCPVKGDGKGGRTVYNVYAQPIDPTNQMPSHPNQLPAPGQDVPLSTERVQSFIPKGGTESETWTYPSPQMFWNALVRKGKSAGAREEDMDVVVAIHNNMNENTWRAVLAWEALHQDGGSNASQQQPQQQGPDPRLSRFMGRPYDLSPKARIKSLFGHPLPFDRHDWIVERKGGQEVRYVIDYYHEDGAAKLNKVPKLHDAQSVKSITVDVRPALDSVEALADRLVRMPLRVWMGETDYRPLPFFWVPKAPPAPSPPPLDLKATAQAIQASCSTRLQAVRTCQGVEDCSREAIELTYCMAQLVCKPQAEAFGKVWQDGKGRGEAVQSAFGGMRDCMDDFESRAAEAAAEQHMRQQQQAAK